MIEDSKWYKKLEKRPWLAVVAFVAGVLLIAGVINLAGLIF